MFYDIHRSDTDTHKFVFWQIIDRLRTKQIIEIEYLQIFVICVFLVAQNFLETIDSEKKL